MNKETFTMIERLKAAGISEPDALTLRRISMTLQRWHELECGIGDDATYYIERETDDEFSPPHMKRSDHTGLHDLGRIPDREKGALTRLSVLMAKYPRKLAYVQTDPRGAALYVLNKRDVKRGEDVSAIYSCGIAVYR